MSRKILKMLLVCTITAGMVTGCGATDSFKEGVKDGVKDATESVSASSVSEEPEETPTETPTEEPTPAVESDSFLKTSGTGLCQGMFLRILIRV